MNKIQNGEVNSSVKVRRLSPLENILFGIGGGLIVIGAIWPIIFGNEDQLQGAIYLLGVLLFSAIQLKASITGGDFVIRRLRRQQILGAILLVLSGLLLFTKINKIGPFHADEWLIVLMVAAVLEVYTSFRLPAEVNARMKK